MSKRQATGSQNVFKALGVPYATEHLGLEGGLVGEGQPAADVGREFGVHHLQFDVDGNQESGGVP